MKALCAAVLFALLPALPALADPPQIVAATAQITGNTYRVTVTLAHPDTGWNHYADGWRVEHADGTVLGTRELLHPHVREQPFTRSLSGVPRPDVSLVFIRARCSVDGWSSERVALDLP